MAESGRLQTFLVVYPGALDEGAGSLMRTENQSSHVQGA